MNDTMKRIKQGLTWKNAKAFMVNNAIYGVILALIATIIIIEPNFVSTQNFTFIITQSSTKLILALGVAGLLVLAGTDLSVGRMVGLSAVVSASLLQAVEYSRRIYPDMEALPIIVPMLFVIVLTATLSAINGYVIAKFKVHAFIVTLSAQLIIYGITSIYYDAVGASPIAGLDERFTGFAQGKLSVFGLVEIPWLVICAAIVTVIVWFIWNKTKLGKNMFAVGGNEEAAIVSGVSVMKTFVLVSILAGVLYGFAGFLEVGRTGSATNNIGNGYELDAIAACVVGGVSFNGGVGSIAGVVTGVLMFQVINYGLTYIDVSPYIQYIVKGLIIVIAVAIDMKKYLKKK